MCGDAQDAEAYREEVFPSNVAEWNNDCVENEVTEKPSTVYFARCEGGVGPIKIGFSKNAPSRIIQLSAWAPFKIELLATISGGFDLEGRFHAKFKADRLHGEWFRESQGLLKDIELINAGRFDVESLPQKERPRISSEPPEVRFQRGLLSRLKTRVSSYPYIGIKIPDGLEDSVRRYDKMSENERADCRNLAEDFLTRTRSKKRAAQYAREQK